ncbi:MAG: PIN domain-containing protein [Vicinamibacterales bacterium]
MAIFAVDANCMIAAVCDWHEQHAAAAAEIEHRLKQGDRITVAAHALAEAYSVLTRLPPPYRLASIDAWAALRANFVEGASLHALDSQGYVSLLDRLAESGVGGGRTYDAMIGDCAHSAGAGALVTLNPKHFEPAPEGVSIVDVSRPS